MKLKRMFKRIWGHTCALNSGFHLGFQFRIWRFGVRQGSGFRVCDLGFSVYGELTNRGTRFLKDSQGSRKCAAVLVKSWY